MDTQEDPFGAEPRVASDSTGVRKYISDAVTPGLVIFHTVVSNKVLVIDADGRVVLEFSKTPPGYSLYRPGKAGDNRNLYCILKSTKRYEDRSIAALNEDGKIIWKTQHHHFTHDFHIRHNRRIVSVLRAAREVSGHAVSDNVICDMDIDGEINWAWSMVDHLDQFEAADQVVRSVVESGNDNPFHVNSVQIADYPVVKQKFGEPAIVASARNMNTVFLVGRDSGKVLYQVSGQTLGQHHARVLPENYKASVGNLLIVDNGYSFLPTEGAENRGFSRILELEIPSGTCVWSYQSTAEQPPFFSPIVGGQQRFANGNTLVTEGYYGRIFEIDYSGKVLWDYVYPESVPLTEHLKDHQLRHTGLRQIYRAYKVAHDWME